MRCKYCGKPLDDDAFFCKYCGEHCEEHGRRAAAARRAAEAEERAREPVRRSAVGDNRRPSNRPAPRRSQKPEESVSVLDQMPKWVIPAACIAASALLITGAVIMILNNHKNDVNTESLDAPVETAVVVTEATTEAVTEAETEKPTLPEETDIPFDTDSEWAQSYYAAIKDFEKSHKETSPKAIKYRLFYIDDDETPELYIQANEEAALYTIVDEEAALICETKTVSDEKLVGIRTRRGTYLTTRSDDEEECYTVYRLRSGEVTEEEVYLSVGETYTVNGSSVDLVDFTQYVRAKQANYQLNGIPQYNKEELLDALLHAVNGDNIPDKAPEEGEMELETLDPDSVDETDSKRTGTARFEVFSGMLTWSEAQAKCKAKGGHLAYIKDESDYKAVIAAIKKADSGLVYLWVGGKTSISGNTVKASWNDGSSTRYLDDEKLWFGHEPSGKDGDVREPYMMLWNPNGERWSFNDNSDSCVKIYKDGTMGYVCEFDD
ncbi:MAG: hypothetical protein K6F80_04115 [Oscillospiraceae bacterium]|nr:hypothetical protein [Oscillospiraceae bacterium]